MFADENEIIPLSKEYLISGGRKIKELSMRTPTVFDVARAMEDSADLKMDPQARDFKKERFLITTICELAPSDLDEFAEYDYVAVQEGLLIMRTKPADRDAFRALLRMEDPKPGEALALEKSDD